MNTAELKLDIFRQIDRIDDRLFPEIYGILNNFFNSTKPIESLLKVSEAERIAIEEGYAQIQNGEGIPHEDVMKKYRNKYAQG